MKTKLKSLFLLIISMQLMACKAPTASDQSSIFDSYLQSEEPSQEVTISDGTSESILSSDEILTSEVDSLLVTFNVEIPIVLNPGDMIKIAGDFNGWDPFAQGYAFTMINEYNYELTLEFAQTQVGTTLLNKYVLVLADQVDTPWANVEGDARDRENTMIGGSSMGGVMSLYMTFAYPSTFGKSLIFSPSMWVYQNNSIETFIQTSNVSQLTNRPKVYVYAGGGELTITPFVPVIYDTLIENGYDDTLVKTHIQSGQGHNEAAWALHLPLALDWLLASI